MNKRILDIGCGKNKVPGAEGLDLVKLDTVDIVHDLNKFPYPIEDSTYDEIYCNHVLEHVNDLVAVMKEIYRIGKNHATVYIRGPHCSCSKTVWLDPTHKRGLSIGMFGGYFSRGGNWSYYSNVNFQVRKIQLNYTLSGGKTAIPNFISKPLTWLANLNRLSQELCERVWSYWVGGFEEIFIELVIIKNQE